MELFRLENICFNSSTSQIIKDVNLTVNQGQTTTLVGLSGSGKSTLLKIMAGIYIPTSGKVFYKGRDLNLMSEKENINFHKECSFLFQDSALWANQTIQQNLELPLKIHFPKISPSDMRDRIAHVCSLIGYEKSITLRPTELSMGEQKLVGFARALLTEPNVLFLDECTLALDNNEVKRISKVLHEFVEKNNTIIYISNNGAFISEFPGQTIIMDNGAIQNG